MTIFISVLSFVVLYYILLSHLFVFIVTALFVGDWEKTPGFGVWRGPPWSHIGLCFGKFLPGRLLGGGQPSKFKLKP